MISDVEHLFICLLAIHTPLLEKYLFKSFAQVLIGLFDLLIMFYKREATEAYLKDYNRT